MRHARKGMTTLEISVVVALIGLFASMAVVNMDGVSRKQRERAAIREISIQAMQARAAARTSQYAVRLAVRPGPGGKGSILRWEQLDCSATTGRWGKGCPSQQCERNACGQNGCNCVALGEAVPMPSTLDVSSIHGLCWMGQGAAPRQMDGTRMCPSNGVPPQAVYRITQKAGNKLDHVLQVDGLTGKARMVDCTGPTVEPLCVN